MKIEKFKFGLDPFASTLTKIGAMRKLSSIPYSTLNPRSPGDPYMTPGVAMPECSESSQAQHPES